MSSVYDDDNGCDRYASNANYCYHGNGRMGTAQDCNHGSDYLRNADIRNHGSDDAGTPIGRNHDNSVRNACDRNHGNDDSEYAHDCNRKNDVETTEACNHGNDGLQQRRRSSVTQVLQLARSVSHVTVATSRQVVHNVGSFLGMTEADGCVELWRDRFLTRVKSGDIGFSVENMLPAGAGGEEVVATLQRAFARAREARRAHEAAIEELSDAGTYTLTHALLDEDDHLSQPSLPSNDGRGINSSSRGRCRGSASAGTPLDNRASRDIVQVPSVVYRHGADTARQRSGSLTSGTRTGPEMTSASPAFLSASGTQEATSCGELMRAYSSIVSSAANAGHNRTGLNGGKSHCQQRQTRERPRLARESLSAEHVTETHVKTTSITFSPQVTLFKESHASKERFSALFRRRSQLPSESETGVRMREGSSPPRARRQQHSASASSQSSCGRTYSADTEFLTGAEALQHYRQHIQMEMAEKKRQRLSKRRKLEKEIQLEKQLLKQAVKRCTDANGATGSWREVVTSLNSVRMLTHGEEQRYGDRGLESCAREHEAKKQEHRPWFIFTISVVQVACMCVLLAAGGVRSVGLEPELRLAMVRTLRGLETKEHWHVHNIWVGPSQRFLISAGALFAPCLRHDAAIYSGYWQAWGNASHGLGCCEMNAWDTAGTTPQQECRAVTHGVGVWREGSCGTRPINASTVAHVIKPCCHGVQGRCNMTSREHCDLLEGVFMEGDGVSEHCSQVNCLSVTCGMGGFQADDRLPYLPVNPHQWWRVVLSLFYHQGVLQLILVLVLQIALGRPIEKTAGWLRTAIIYVTSGVMGQMTGCLVTPHLPHAGADSAAAGLLAVTVVELSQSWKLVSKPVHKLACLLTICLILLAVGTLPLVQNVTILGGYFFGALSGIIFLPYITFGHWQAFWRKVLVLVLVPYLLAAIFVVLYLFYEVQHVAERCGELCDLMNCVPYTPNMCRLPQLW